MTAPVRIEAEAWSDLRFATLARLLGMADSDHALIRSARIWSWQAEHYTPEAPTYVVDADLIESALGPGGAAAMVRAKLAEAEPGGFRIRGARGRIEWLWQRRQASAKGGEAMKRIADNKHKPSGYPDGQPGPKPKPSPLSLALTLPDLRSDLDLEPPKPPFGGSAAADRFSPGSADAMAASAAPAQAAAAAPCLADSDAVKSQRADDPPRRARRSRSKPSDPTPDESASVRVVLEKLGVVSGVSFRGADAHVRLIVGRLRDGVSELELRAVIAYCDETWEGKPEMRRYLRPETLFGPTTIAKYLDPARSRFAKELAAAASQPKLKAVP